MEIITQDKEKIAKGAKFEADYSSCGFHLNILVLTTLCYFDYFNDPFLQIIVDDFLQYSTWIDASLLL